MSKLTRMFHRKNDKQKPSLLSNMLVGDVDVSGHIEIVVPRATDRVIHIDITTHEQTAPLTELDPEVDETLSRIEELLGITEPSVPTENKNKASYLKRKRFA